MRSTFSEFAYGYAIIEQFAQGYSFSAAPVLPSLRLEATLGYDAEILINGTPLFLQFKLSDCLTRWSANQAHQLGVPHYRMHLRPARHSEQHQLLLQLEANGELVYYIAPIFHRISELNSHYLNRSVIQNSVVIRPSSIGPLPDNDEHYVAFNRDRVGLRCSKETKSISKKMLEPGLFMQDVDRAISHGNQRVSNSDYLQGLLSKMIQIIETSKQRGMFKEIDARTLTSDRPTLNQVSYLARTFLGCEMLVAR